ncbi:hypothetical protein ACOSQ2_018386 [Xanthoceras sorbifolium]
MKLHSLPQLPLGHIVDRSFDFLTKFQEANSTMLSKPAQSIPRWSAPYRNLNKINTDAGMDLNKSLVGLGIIIRDHSSAVLAASAQKLVAGYSVDIAEALAVLRVL